MCIRDSPHIVSVHYVLTTPKGPLIALDLVEGADLRKLAGPNFNGTLYQGGRAKANERVDALVAQIYKGLAHLHERCVLHQDIKPEVRARLSRRADLGGERERRLSLSARAFAPPPPPRI